MQEESMMKFFRLLVWGLCIIIMAPGACTIDAEVFGTVTTYAGLAGTSGHIDGPLAEARFNRPEAMAFDYWDNLLVGDSGNKSIRRIILTGTDAGTVETLWPRPGQGDLAIQGDIRGLAIDSQRNILFTDHHAHQVFLLETDSNGRPTGNVTTFGSGTLGYRDGPAEAAMFNYPQGISVDSLTDVIYVADTYNNRVRRIDRMGNVTTFAGSTKDYAEGQGVAAKFKEIVDVAVYRSGETVSIIVSDTWNHCIRVLDSEGNSGMYAAYQGSWGHKDGGSALAKVGTPQFLFLDAGGSLYFTDGTIPAIRKVTPGHTVSPQPTPGQPGKVTGPDKIAGRFVSTVAGFQGFSSQNNFFIGHGYQDGNNLEARFDTPRGIAVRTQRNVTHVYVADVNNHVIRRIAY